MAKKVFVGNLPYSVGDQELREGFEAYGEVVSANVVLDRETQRPRGFGFVEFTTEEAVAAAIEGLNGREFGGRNITVREAEDRRPPRGPGGRPSRPPGGGGYRGGGGGGGGYEGGGYRGGGGGGGHEGGGYRGGGGGGFGGPPPGGGFPDQPDEGRRRNAKKRKKGQRKERDWDRDGGANVGGSSRREREKRTQDYLDYDDD
ncbi:MAG: RNA-binding protein [Myxococcales bacterium]|nr:RNA-binding protein [Myxococcales bacterium]